MALITLLHDGTVELSTGRSRKEVRWKNKELTWSALLDKLSTTQRTGETIAEYLGAKRDQQDIIKDVGGFVGGHLSGGHRRKTTITCRRLVTLDIDHSKGSLWDDFTMLFNSAAAMYSTHKHTPDAPRLRLILPLDRPVLPDEYEAIARYVAGVIDIEVFDATTFEPSRLMYWPSTARDGQYVFTYQDGPWLCADTILATYRDWRDTSEWPVSERNNSVIQRAIKKQGDPLEKPGIVGAFCRTYTIHDVISTYLSDIYEPCDVEGRYTYKEGSTAAGLVTYDDKYAYSHHGTDPASGKLCNAFDLVRLHKFGLKDEDVREGTPGNKLPSYLAMQDLATMDAQVRTLAVTERLDEARADFQDVSVDDTPADSTPVDDTWKSQLDMDRKGNCHSTINNILLVLENDPYFKGRIAYDDFEKCGVALTHLPWRKVTQYTRRLIDKDDANIRHYLEQSYGISNLTKTRDAIEVLDMKTSFHPVRDYLNAQTWDGEPRVDSLLVDYQGAVDNDYTRTVTRKTLVAAVARIFQPGIKFDHVLVLVGKQGLKKSTLIGKLGRQWFTDSFNTVEGKESFEQLQGVWLVEMAELSALAKAEVEKIKHFITKRDDRYRVAFGRRVEKFPRQCVFFATTNKRDFLRDPTGDRRYWPVLVNETTPEKDVFTDLTEYEIGQIWAEAVYLYRKGETIYLPEEMVEIATAIQRAHTEEHPWTGIISEYLDTKVPETWPTMTRYERAAFLQDDEPQIEGTMYRERVCIHELWIEALNRRDTIDERSANIVRNVMANIEGWADHPEPARYGIYGTQRKGFIRTEVPKKVLMEINELCVTKGVTK